MLFDRKGQLELGFVAGVWFEGAGRVGLIHSVDGLAMDVFRMAILPIANGSLVKDEFIVALVLPDVAGNVSVGHSVTDELLLFFVVAVMVGVRFKAGQIIQLVQRLFDSPPALCLHFSYRKGCIGRARFPVYHGF